MADKQSPGYADQLAEGEDPSTNSLAEARRWLSVYTELVHLESALIESVKARLPRMSPEARRVTEKTNLPALERDAERFRNRLGYWRERFAELEKTN